MVYADPPDFPNGTTVNASTLNRYVRDNLESLRDQDDLRAYLWLTSGPLGVANNATQVIQWTTHFGLKSTAMWNAASGTRIYLPAVGRWRLWGAIGWSTNTTIGSRGVYFQQNGTSPPYELEFQAGDANAGGAGIFLPYQNFAVDHYTSSTDNYITFLVNQDSGTTMSLSTGAATVAGTRVGVRYLGERTLSS